MTDGARRRQGARVTRPGRLALVALGALVAAQALCAQDVGAAGSAPRAQSTERPDEGCARPEPLCEEKRHQEHRAMAPLRRKLADFENAHATAWSEGKVARFRELLDELTDEEHRQTRLRGKIALGFSGDRTPSGGGDLYKVSLDGSISRGTYPSEFSFDARLSVQLQDDSFVEEVSTFRAKYDYFARPEIEVYGFAERFSNNFLSIEQRYEVGTGVYFGKELGTRPSARVARTREVLEGRGIVDQAVLALKGREQQFAHARETPGEEDLRDLDHLRQEALKSLKKREARLAIGVAFSVFGELERASIKTALREDPKASALTFTPEATQQFRWTVRPTLRARPTEHLSLSVLWYLKCAIGGGVEGAPSDYRSDIHASIGYALGRAETIGDEKVSLTLSYDSYYDNAPPVLTAADTGGRPLDTLVTTKAQRRHEALAFQVRVEWN